MFFRYYNEQINEKNYSNHFEVKLDNNLKYYTKDYFEDGNYEKLMYYFNNNPNIISNNKYMFFGHSHVLQSFIKNNMDKIFKKGNENIRYSQDELKDMLKYHKNKDSVLNNNNYIWEISIEENNIKKIKLINNGKSKPNRENIIKNNELLCEGTYNYMCKKNYEETEPVSQYTEESKEEYVPVLQKQNKLNKKYKIVISGRYETKGSNLEDYELENNKIIIYTNGINKFPQLDTSREYTLDELKKLHKGSNQSLNYNKWRTSIENY